MNPAEKLNLQNMIQSNDVVETTDLIREIKHSEKIRDEVKMLNHLKKKHNTLMLNSPEEFDNLCVNKCLFLFNHYTDIFNKVKKDELDLTILDEFLNVLKKIEDGKLDQHEGSYEIGKLLKKLYVDSALRKADKLNELEEKKDLQVKVKEISWSQYKKFN